MQQVQRGTNHRHPGCIVCRAHHFYFLPWAFWPGYIYGRKQDQGNWCAKSAGCISSQYHHVAIKGFFEAGNDFVPGSMPGGMVDDDKVVAELSFQGVYDMAGFFICWLVVPVDIYFNSKLPVD